MPIVEITPAPLSTQSMADLLCTLIVLCRGKNSQGKDFWAYMCIKPSMAKSFREACQGSFNLEDFGTIIEYGEGENVPEQVRERIELYYGANHHYETMLAASVEKLQNQYLMA